MRNSTDLTKLYPIGKIEPQLTDIEVIAKTVRSSRKEYGLTQTTLAGLSGTGLRFISELERGKPTVSFKKMMDVLAVLGLGIEVIQMNPRRSTTSRHHSVVS